MTRRNAQAAGPTGASRFDAAYYRRHYENRRTAVTSRHEMLRRGAFIGAFVCYLDLPVRTILDAGCGLGWLRRPLLAAFPRARYTGLEASEYLCRRYGWLRGSLASHHPGSPYDLVVCYDVLQYLDDHEASRAMANLTRLTRRALYFSALTQEDWDLHCDQLRTEGEVHIRPASWYLARLEGRFDAVGCGLFLRHGIDVALWAIERHQRLTYRPPK